LVSLDFTGVFSLSPLKSLEGVFSLSPLKSLEFCNIQLIGANPLTGLLADAK